MDTTIATSTIIFECIDGKDDHFKIELENGRRIMLGNSDGENSVAVKEFENGGCMHISNDNGVLHFDASDCAVPVKINGNPATKGVLTIADVLKVGNSIWKVFGSANENEALVSSKVNLLKTHFHKYTGLEDLKDFKMKQIFSNVFKKHTLVQMEDQLVTGTFNNTPGITDIEVSWAKPWLFSRLLLVSVCLAAVLIAGFNMYPNPNLVPGIIFLGSFAVPISGLVFFLEMNAPRNISIFFTMILFLIGGVASLIVALVFFDKLIFLSFLGASSAGIIEEIAKLLIVIFVMGQFTRYKWTLNGLLFGAAVGTGFAAFESAGYAFQPILQGGGIDHVVDSIVLRGILAPFCHIIWTANAAAALWFVKGDKKFSWSMVKDPRFLRIFVSSVILHMLWNAPFGIFPIPIFLDVKLLILGLVGWAITLRLIQMGLNELNKSRHEEIERLRSI